MSTFCVPSAASGAPLDRGQVKLRWGNPTQIKGGASTNGQQSPPGPEPPRPGPHVPPPGPRLPARAVCRSTAGWYRPFCWDLGRAVARRAAAHAPPTPLTTGRPKRRGTRSPLHWLLQLPLKLRLHLSYRQGKVVSSHRAAGTATGRLRRETKTSEEGFQKYLASRAVQGLLVLNPVRIEAWPLSGNNLLRVTVPLGASWLLMPSCRLKKQIYPFNISASYVPGYFLGELLSTKQSSLPLWSLRSKRQKIINKHNK